MGNRSSAPLGLHCICDDDNRAAVEKILANHVKDGAEWSCSVDAAPPSVPAAAVTIFLTPDAPRPAMEAISAIRGRYPACFIACVGAEREGSLVAPSAAVRQALTDAGANMVTGSVDHLITALSRVAECYRARGPHTCPLCQGGGPSMTEDALCVHLPLYHVDVPHREAAGLECPVCRTVTREPLGVHICNAHGPAGRGEAKSEYAETAPDLYAFALVVVRRPADGRFLVVQEFGGNGYWLPGGRVDAGESLQHAAIRETLEEAGVRIVLDGVIRMEFAPHRRIGRSYVRMRVIFLGHPEPEDQVEKTVPDYESVGACWLSYDELKGVRLRGSEPLVFFKHVLAGKHVSPMSVLRDREG